MQRWIMVQYFSNIFYSMDQGILRQNKDLEHTEWVGQFYVQLKYGWLPVISFKEIEKKNHKQYKLLQWFWA
jgi:hypothetical protein